MRRGFMLFALLVLVSFVPGAISPTSAAERLTWTVRVDGETRSAIIEPGKDAATVPSPLVFVFHGANGFARWMTDLGLAEAWPEATIVYPDGPHRPNSLLGVTTTGWQYHPGQYDDQDVRFVDALLKEISAAYKVDERRVYATGHSNGAGFSYVLLTMRPDRFAAVAPVAMGAIPCLKWARVPRPVLITHGERDPISLSWAERARNQLLRLNGCAADGTGVNLDAASPSPCRSGQPVVWSVHGGEHVWPLGTSERMVRFFKEHPLPASGPTPQASGEPETIAALAGNGRAGFSGDGDAAPTAQLQFPEGLALALDGSLFIADTGNQRIRKVGPDGMIRTVAGSSASSAFQPPDGEEIPALPAHLLFPEGVAADRAGNLFIADTLNRLVRKVTPEGLISTVAGKKPVGATIGFSGDDGPGLGAELSFPTGLAIDRTGRLFIADTENHRVRMVDRDGKITTFAGTGTAGYSGDNGLAKQAQLNEPWSLAADLEGNLYIADASNHCVRKVAPDGTISTVAGTGVPGFSGDKGEATEAQLNHPLGLAVDSQRNLFIADQRNYRVRRVAPDGEITTVFGGASSEGISSAAPRYYPSGVAVDGTGNLLIADPFRHRIWKVAGVAAPGLVAGLPFPQPQP